MRLIFKDYLETIDLVTKGQLFECTSSLHKLVHLNVSQPEIIPTFQCIRL